MGRREFPAAARLTAGPSITSSSRAVKHVILAEEYCSFKEQHHGKAGTFT